MSYQEKKHIICAQYFLHKPHQSSKLNKSHEHTIIVMLWEHLPTHFIKCENEPYKLPTKNHPTIYIHINILYFSLTTE
jgi:hypothetical protein